MNSPDLLRASWPKLPPAARDLLAAVLLHERPVPVGWLDLLTPDPGNVDLLAAGGLIIESDSSLTPARDLDRSVLQSMAPWSQRRRIHLLLAEACMRPPGRLEAAGKHFEAAGQNTEAAHAYLAAAETHCRRHRHAAGKRAFLAALRLLPADTPEEDVVRALQNLSQCATLAAEVSDAVTELRHWAQTPPWSDRTTVRAEANLVLAALFAREGRHVESARMRRSAARDLAALGRDAEAATASLAASGVLTYAGQLRLALEAAAAAVNAAARVGGPELQAQAATWRGLILGMQGHIDAAVAELERALDLALRHALTGTAAEAYRLLGSVHEYASLYRDEQTAFANALRYCRKHGETHTAGICLGCLSYSYFRSGNWKRSEETARSVLADRKIPESSRHVAGSVLGLLHAHRGELRPAQRLLRHSLASCRRIGLLLMDFFNLAGLALVAESLGSPDDATRRWVEFVEFWRSTDDRHDAIPGLSAAVCHFAAHGRADDAASAAEALEVIASATSNPEAAGAAHAATAELLLLEGRPQPAIRELRLALTAFEQRVLSIEPIRARLRLGAALLQNGDDEEARIFLREARQKARRLGARPLATQAEALLSAPRSAPEILPPQPSAAAGWELLSTRQREVARHLVHGRTNKEISARLSVSVRTVDMHVAHVLARLDCRSRAEAVARIAVALA